MLNRHNSMTLHQPVMPFKWRPFDLYNNIHINATNDSNNAREASTTAAASTSNCMRCRSNCEDLMLWGNFRRHRQSSRGSSSGSSCTSLSTTSHFIGDADSGGSNLSMAISKSNASHDYYRKLGGKHDSNHDKLRCAHHQQRTNSCACFIGATINCCCDSHCRSITQMSPAMFNDNTHCRCLNSVLAVPFGRAEQITNGGQPFGSSKRCESPRNCAASNVLNSTDNPVNNISKQYRGNGYFDHCTTINRSKSLADSKYFVFLIAFCGIFSLSRTNGQILMTQCVYIFCLFEHISLAIYLEMFAERIVCMN